MFQCPKPYLLGQRSGFFLEIIDVSKEICKHFCFFEKSTRKRGIIKASRNKETVMANKKISATPPKKSENIFSKIKKCFINGCVWYTVVSLMFLIINLAFSKNGASSISAKSFFLIFPFGLSMSGAGMLYRSKLPRWSRILSHYLISIVSFLVFMLLPAGSASSGVVILLMLVLLSVIYWILFALVHIFQIRWKRVLDED